MTDRQAQQANKWLDRRQDTANQWQSANSHFSVRDVAVTGSMMSDGSPSLMFSVGGEKRLTSKQMRDILNMPDDGLDRSLMSNAIWGLLEQAKQLRTKTKDDGLQEFQSTNRSMAFQSEIGQVKFKRSALVQEQEGLRAEILQLNERLGMLEEIKTTLTNKSSKKSPKKRGVPAINQKSMSIDQIAQELLELGVVKKLSTSDKVGQNDEAVSQHHTELIKIQRKSIDEMSKYELLQLKKPKYTLLMDRVSR